MDVVEHFISVSFSIMGKTFFSPLVLIGLLITSLSLVLNLKDANAFIEDFRKSTNIRKFIRLIYNTILIALAMFLLGLLSLYIEIPDTFTWLNSFLLGFLSFIYISLLLWLTTNLFSIAFTIKSIVLTSLEDDL